jgi:predicted hotdog family 3-hydroxylacyl-ACP dehydratase
MLVTKAEIANMIPHSGAMCLLDGVVQWDKTTIRCVSQTHQDENNPMRSNGQLPALCGIEYAAQAMAVHGALSGLVGAKPRAGYLANLRDVVCRVSRLDNLASDLIVDATQVMGDDSLAIYQFSLHAGEVELLAGRATVVLDAGGETV